ncbi:hypothetical protein HK100_005043 [Physocladia obscura]|uniref:Uncharacterized protein n=1 Tax=Physocladia obscura TaxID=109957 RepID=A0AAD5TFL7_9FUNG|nr:hypothetical protein HK100_005043 [Physocladia obscura]
MEEFLAESLASKRTASATTNTPAAPGVSTNQQQQQHNRQQQQQNQRPVNRAVRINALYEGNHQHQTSPTLPSGDRNNENTANNKKNTIGGNNYIPTAPEPRLRRSKSATRILETSNSTSTSNLHSLSPTSPLSPSSISQVPLASTFKRLFSSNSVNIEPPTPMSSKHPHHTSLDPLAMKLEQMRHRSLSRKSSRPVSFPIPDNDPQSNNVNIAATSTITATTAKNNNSANEHNNANINPKIGIIPSLRYKDFLESQMRRSGMEPAAAAAAVYLSQQSLSLTPDASESSIRLEQVSPIEDTQGTEEVENPINVNQTPLFSVKTNLGKLYNSGDFQQVTHDSWLEPIATPNQQQQQQQQTEVFEIKGSSLKNHHSDDTRQIARDSWDDSIQMQSQQQQQQQPQQQQNQQQQQREMQNMQSLRPTSIAASSTNSVNISGSVPPSSLRRVRSISGNLKEDINQNAKALMANIKKTWLKPTEPKVGVISNRQLGVSSATGNIGFLQTAAPWSGEKS